MTEIGRWQLFQGHFEALIDSESGATGVPGDAVFLIDTATGWVFKYWEMVNEDGDYQKGWSPIPGPSQWTSGVPWSDHSSLKRLAGMAQLLGVNYFVAGMASRDIEFFAAPEQSGRQRQANWCWAACIQMVLNWHGLLVNQEDIVQNVFGGQFDAPARLDEIIGVLNGRGPDVRGGWSAVRATSQVNAGTDIISDLDQGRPLIVGLKGSSGVGHACVLTAAYYSLDAAGKPLFDKLVVRDPWPTVESRVELVGHNFIRRHQFLARVWVERL